MMAKVWFYKGFLLSVLVNLKRGYSVSETAALYRIGWNIERQAV